ncbi:MAG TPA: hypothetical protein DCQ06_04120 [Myxococcales bacterium]|nr:hypothetical protein [Myxococcales bacterium]
MGGETVNSALDRNRLFFSAMVSSTFIHASHTVDKSQHEPGVALKDQPFIHELDFVYSGLTLNARYGINSRWGVALNVPVRAVHITAGFKDIEGRNLPEFQSIHHRTELVAGLGDVQLTGHFRALRANAPGQWTIDLSFGTSLPTGGTEPDPFVLGAKGQSHQHMFFGHGTFDPVIAFELSRRGESFRFQAFGNAKVPLVENEFGFRGPRTIAGGLGIDSGFGTQSWRFVIQGGLFTELSAAWSGQLARNSGRSDVVLTAGANYLFKGGGALIMLARMPINLTVAGGQMQLSPVLTIGYATSAGFE